MHRLRNFIGALLALLVLGVTFVMAQEDPAADARAAQPDDRFVGQVPSPEFPTGVDWINVSGPLTLDDLRGKVVLLDFWTYGCINCIHMIPILAELEEKYADELIVIGVHSAKFENEGETTNIRQIVQRYDLHHPVINDSDFAVWETFAPYGVQAWPTFALIDPRGNILAVQPGEVPFEAFDRVIGGMVEYFDAAGEINREPVELSLEGEGLPSTALSFPGKVLADTDGNRLFIADSSNNRYIIADLTTFEVLDTIGNGTRGFADGSYDEAMFDTPQGMTLSPDGNTLYVADVNNHAIRAVDLVEQTVTTIAGTGIMGRTFVDFEDRLPGSITDLRSPWDVELGADENTLYIAMAGTHQIWSMDLESGELGPFIGSGREGLRGGTFDDAELAQPSGLYFADDVLYIADSESSSIRAADIAANEVVTLAGPSQNNLFQFGDVDGETGTSRLQHALGVVGVEDGTLYVADTYNSKIKHLDPETMTIETALGEGGDGGYLDGGADTAQFDEPGGLDYANGLLYVADTNNHAIRIIDLETMTVSTVAFPNPEALQIEGRTTVVGGNSSAGEQITLNEQTVAAGEGEIVINLILPEGYKVNELAPSALEAMSDGEAVIVAEDNAETSIDGEALPVRVPVTLSEGSDVLHVNVMTYFCEEEDTTLCFIDNVTYNVPVTVSEDAEASEIAIERTIPLPEIVAGTQLQ